MFCGIDGIAFTAQNGFMDHRISTEGIVAASRSRHWHEAIANTYFPLDLTFKDTEQFSGELKSWQLGPLSLSRLTSQPLMYRRLPRHLRGERDEEFLITVPAQSPVYFSQCGQDVRCHPGGFILERSHEPYEFSHDEAADLWVVKVGYDDLAARVRSPGRFCSMEFDGSGGIGGLFIDMLHSLPARVADMNDEARSLVGQQLIDLIGLSVQADERTLTSGTSSVRAAHLTRVEKYVRDHLSDPDLDPERIAGWCGISVRYLHQLFRDTNRTLGQWIRDRRLDACQTDLKDPFNRLTIAEIAFSHGFSDQAQFSRAFRNRFGQSPSDFRAENTQSN